MSAGTVVAQFETEEGLLEGVKAAKRAGLTVIDAYTPFAVHGLDEAMELKRSRLPWVCFFAGLTGAVLALGFQVWVSAASWALNVGGKPFVSLPAFIPVTFEVTVLFAALGSVAVFFARSKLWPGKRAGVLPRVTDDRFALVVADNGEQGRAALFEAGAVEVTPS